MCAAPSRSSSMCASAWRSRSAAIFPKAACSRCCASATAGTGGLLAFLWDKIFPYVDARPQILAPMIVSELLVGGLIGAMTRLYMEALRFMGSAIAMLIGYGGSGGPAIEEPEPQAALAAI